MEVIFGGPSHGIWQKLQILAFSKIKGEDDRRSNHTFASIIDEKIKEAKGLELTQTSLAASWLEDVSFGKFQLVFTSH